MRLSVIGGGTFHAHNGKVADITHADTNKHTVDLSAFVPENCVAIVVYGRRVVGAGELLMYPDEGTFLVETFWKSVEVIAIRNQRLEYELSVKNDDFDLYLMGYWVQ